jgi:hypothetical protein
MRKNRLLSFVLAMVMLFGVVSAFGVTAMAEDEITVTAVYDPATSTATVTWSEVPTATSYSLWILNVDEEGNWRQLPSTMAFSVDASEPRSYTYHDGYFTMYGYGCDGYRIEIEAKRYGITLAEGTSSVFNTGKPFLSAPQVTLSEFGIASCPTVDHAEFYSFSLYAAQNDYLISSASGRVPNHDFSQYMVKGNEYYVRASVHEPSGTYRASKNVYSNKILFKGPAITGTATISPSNPTPNSTVTSSLGGALQNIPADKLHYQWQISRPNSMSFSDISGETGATMEIGADINPGYKFRLAVWADGYSGSVISNIVTVSETLTGTATISPSRPKPGETMTVNLGGVLASIPADKLHYQWQSSSRAGAQLIDISGATGATYTVPADATSNYSFRVVITADGYDGSIISATVMLGGPALTGQVTISPSNPKVGDTLDASVRITTPGYSGRTLYQWQRSVDAGSSVFEDIPLATGSTYIPVQEDAGKQIRLSVSAGGYDGSIVSAPVTVAEDKTLSGTVTISPSNPAAGTTLTSTRSGGVADISARDLNYQWQSKSNGRTFANIRLATSSTYTIPSSAADGTQYRLMVTADGYTGTLYSNTVTVGGESFEKGDVNRDGSVSNSDLILVARHVVNLITLTGEQFTLGDMNDDKQITNTDIITVARKIVGL